MICPYVKRKKRKKKTGTEKAVCLNVREEDTGFLEVEFYPSQTVLRLNYLIRISSLNFVKYS